MKLNPIQVAASAAGAVLSALIASSFGVKGTVIGVAVGSVVATSASALVGDWLTRTHHVVRKAVTKSPGTGTAAGTDDRPGPASAGPRFAAGAAGTPGGNDLTGEGAPSDRLVASSRLASAPRSGHVGSFDRATAVRRRARPWRVLAASALIVFAVALATVTVVEAIAGRPLSSLVGGGGPESGTSAGDLLTGSPTTTTTTTPPPATTTTTTPPPATTTTTTPGPTPTTTPSSTAGTPGSSPPTTTPTSTGGTPGSSPPTTTPATGTTGASSTTLPGG